MVYSAEVVRGWLPQLMEVLGDAICDPQFDEDEIMEQKQAIVHELENLSTDVALWLPEMAHRVAYGDEGLGLPQICPPHQLEKLGRKELMEFVKKYYIAPRAVISGAGVEHAELVDLVSKHFGDLPASGSVENSKITKIPARYKGGMHVEVMTPEMEKKLKLLMPEEDKAPPSHILVLFEAISALHPDIYPACVLQSLLGGGSSFSTGGPGKGMHSRMYTRILNQYQWVESASAFSGFYEDSGLFGVWGASEHNHIGKMMELVCVELVEILHGSIDEEELNRAKNLLRSGVLMGLETRAMLCEDIGKQVLTEGQRKSAEEQCELIGRVGVEDLRRVVRHMLKSKPTVVGFTPQRTVSAFPDYDDLCAWFKRNL